MKTIIVVRHAKAVWTESEHADFQRNLDPQGFLDAEKLGQLFLQEGIIPDIVICSSAIRALKTTEIIVDNLGLPLTIIKKKDILYNAPCERILSLVQSLDVNQSIAMLVAHNPGVSDFVSMITDGSLISMGTCDAAIIALKIDNWEHCSPGAGFLSRYIENY